MTSVLFTNARIVDGTAAERGDPVSVLAEGGTIREVARSIPASSAEIVDLKGRTLMPGLIDAMSTSSPASPISDATRLCRIAV